MFLEDKSKSAGVTAPADPLSLASLASLIAWLRTQDAEREYEFYNCSGYCLIAQYLKSVNAYGYGAYNDFSEKLKATCGSNAFAIAGRAPFTFGAALSRALAIQGRS